MFIVGGVTMGAFSFNHNINRMEGLGENGKGHLTIGGCDTIDLAEIYGTPLYVMDEAVIRNYCHMYKTLMDGLYGNKYKVIFASKAFNCKEICRIMSDEGMCLDVVSEGELYTALKAHFPSENIYFHGSNKTHAELVMAVEFGVGRIVIDNLNEAEMLCDILSKHDKNIDVLLRVTPGVEVHTHSFIKTGQLDSKFGCSLCTGEAFEVVSKIMKFDRINFKGIHCHIGSQIKDVGPFVYTANIMMDFVGKINCMLGVEIEEVNLGGGFGIKYFEGDGSIDYKKCLESVSKIIKQRVSQFNLKQPCICIEPGRSIVGQAGITLYKVGNIKQIPGIRTYVSVDGGMTDNPRYIMYRSKYSVMNASKVGVEMSNGITIAGKCCESGDLIQENISIPFPERGDILAVLCTGAYNYAMSSNYNRTTKPAVVMVKDGEHRLIVKQQTLDDLIAQDL